MRQLLFWFVVSALYLCMLTQPGLLSQLTNWDHDDSGGCVLGNVPLLPLVMRAQLRHAHSSKTHRMGLHCVTYPYPYPSDHFEVMCKRVMQI
jgi:hypothetical protein